MQFRIYSPENPYPLLRSTQPFAFQQADALRSLGHQVEVVYFSQRPSRSKKLWNLLVWNMAFGESTYYGANPTPYRTLESVDVEIFQFSVAHPWLHALPRSSGTKRIVHIHNLESNVCSIRASNTRNVFSKVILRRNVQLLARHELELGSLVDEIWCLNETDVKIMRALSPETNCRFVSNIADPITYEGLGFGIQTLPKSNAYTTHDHMAENYGHHSKVGKVGSPLPRSNAPVDLM